MYLYVCILRNPCIQKLYYIQILLGKFVPPLVLVEVNLCLLPSISSFNLEATEVQFSESRAQ